jgi:hypothetical protein
MNVKRWGRLQRVRSVAEQQARMELERANAALRDAETSVGEQLLARTNAKRMARAALLAGDRTEWHLAEAMREVSEWNVTRAEVNRRDAEAAVGPAQIIFMNARREDEQMKALRKKMAAVEEIKRRRAEQAAADEWFGQAKIRAGNARAGNENSAMKRERA